MTFEEFNRKRREHGLPEMTREQWQRARDRFALGERYVSDSEFDEDGFAQTNLSRDEEENDAVDVAIDDILNTPSPEPDPSPDFGGGGGDFGGGGSSSDW